MCCYLNLHIHTSKCWTQMFLIYSPHLDFPHLFSRSLPEVFLTDSFSYQSHTFFFFPPNTFWTQHTEYKLWRGRGVVFLGWCWCTKAPRVVGFILFGWSWIGWSMETKSLNHREAKVCQNQSKSREVTLGSSVSAPQGDWAIWPSARTRAGV